MAQFTNQASVEYNGTVVNSNIVTGEVKQVLSVYKNATKDTYVAGDILTYVVNVRNTGTTNYTGLTVTDNLGAYTVGAVTRVPLTFTGDPVLYYVDGVLQPTPTTVPGPPLSVNAVTVLAGKSTVLVYRVTLNEFAPLAAGSTITNEVSLSGGGLSETLIATETVTLNPNSRLSIFKALNPTVIPENGELTYTFTIENTGATTAGATADIIVSDTFDPALDAPLTVTLNGVTWPMAGNYTYNNATGEFATVAGRITVPAATFTQDPITGVWTTTPGVTTLTVTGTI